MAKRFPGGHARTLRFVVALAGLLGLGLLPPMARGQGGPGPGPPVGSDVEDPRGSVTAEEGGGALGGQDERNEELGDRGQAGPSGGTRRGRTPGEIGSSRLGPPLGASGTSFLDNSPGTQGRPLGGRMGPTGNRAPVEGLIPPTSGRRASQERPGLNLRPPEAEQGELRRLQRLQRLEIPPGSEDPGPANGLTLDVALDLLLRRNLDLMALQYEIPKAEADVLTAGLRSNPIFYADAQLVPYGHYSDARPGGQLQYDVNVTLPLDVSGKRNARKAVAERAKNVTEAQFQDAVRNRIDDLYRAYVNVLSARETLRYTALSVT